MWKTSMLVVLSAVMIAGCATTVPAPVEKVKDVNADAVMVTLEAFSQGLITQDVDAIMATVSENFESGEASSKEEVAGFFKGVIDEGYLNGLEVYLEDVKITSEGDEAEAFEFDVSGNRGATTVDLWLKKEGDVWMISNMETY